MGVRFGAKGSGFSGFLWLLGISVALKKTISFGSLGLKPRSETKIFGPKARGL